MSAAPPPPYYYYGAATPGTPAAPQPMTATSGAAEALAGLAGCAGTTAATPGVCAASNKKLFIGTRKYVICRDVSATCDADSPELWRFEFDDTSKLAPNDTYITFTNGIVVARCQKHVKGLDPNTGREIWDFKLESNGVFNLVLLVPAGPILYIGVMCDIIALSVADGRMLWTQKMRKNKVATPIFFPAIVPCGPNVLTIAGNKLRFIDVATGSVRWKSKTASLGTARIASAAWDGASTVLVGHFGYVTPFDLATGAERETINLKNTGFFHVNLVYNPNKGVFYAATRNAVFALSGGSTNTILWRCDVKTGAYSNLMWDYMKGCIYTCARSKVCCVGEDGSLVYKKKFSQPLSSSEVQLPVFDLYGTGRIYFGAAGWFGALNSAGELVGSDGLKGMLYGPVSLCTPTACIDENATGATAYIFAVILSKRQS